MKSAIRKRIWLSILLGLAAVDIALLVTGHVGVLSALVTLVLVSIGIVEGARLTLRHSRLIWRLRNRLIVTYVFVGVVPIVLILVLTFLGMWIVVGQIATYLVTSELNRRAVALENPARFLSEAPANDRADVVKQLAPLLQGRYPGFEVLVTGDAPFRYPVNSTLEPPPEGWRKFTGIVEKDGRYSLMALARTGDTQAIVIAPLTGEVLGQMVPGLGSVNLGGKWAGFTPDASNQFDFEATWFNEFEAASWKRPNRTQTAVLEVSTRPSLVLAVVFGDRVDWAQSWLTVFVVVGMLLAIVELLSVVVSGSITRTITSAVDHLYVGTVNIAKGDFKTSHTGEGQGSVGGARQVVQRDVFSAGRPGAHHSREGSPGIRADHRERGAETIVSAQCAAHANHRTGGCLRAGAQRFRRLLRLSLSAERQSRCRHR